MTSYDSRVLLNQGGSDGGDGGSGTTIEMDINLRGVHNQATAYSAGDGVRGADGNTYIATADIAANGAVPPAAPWARYTGPMGRDGRNGLDGNDGDPGAPGARVWVQYSNADGISWHDNFVPSSDVHMRIAVATVKPSVASAAWGSAIRIVGEKGEKGDPGGGTGGGADPVIVSFSANTTIADDADSGNTYHFTGDAGVTLTLPKASNAGEVNNGWEVVIYNGGTDSLEIGKQGLDTINGENTLTLYAGRAMRIQKFARRVWLTTSIDQEARLAAARAQNAADTVAGDLLSAESQIESAIQTANNAVGTANGAARAAQTADEKAVAAQLAVDTVITINKPLIAGLLTGQNIDINFEHPIGAYAGANTIALESRGRTYYGNTNYNPNLPRQTIQVGLDTTILTNLNDNNALDPGDFVYAILRLQTGTDAASAVRRWNLNIPVVARGGLSQREVDARVREVAGPAIIVNNIASWDAAQNRFEDSSGNPVTIPDGSIVALTKAVYDAAEADPQYARNDMAIFITR